MSFIQTVGGQDAGEKTAEMLDRAEAAYGYLPNMVKAFSHRPEVMDAWNGLLGSIKVNMDVRRYELVTIAAAKQLRSSYCMLAHGSILLRGHFTASELHAIVENSDTAALSALDRAIMHFAGKVVRDATSMTTQDVDVLRGHGLSDPEIFDIVTAAAVRCFFSKTLDALGVQPDKAYNDIEAGLRNALLVGRDIESEGDGSRSL